MYKLALTQKITQIVLTFYVVFASMIYAMNVEWSKFDLLGFDPVDASTGSDLTTVFLREDEDNSSLRLQFYNLRDYVDQTDIEIQINDDLPFSIIKQSIWIIDSQFKFNLNRVEVIFQNAKPIQKLIVNIFTNGIITDQYQWNNSPREFPGNAAFVHHGNQSLTFTSVLYGEPPEEHTGFDEVLEIHQATGVPGNFHMSGTLMSAAEWHNPEFNDWLSAGVQEGWAGMLTSAFAQHMMPFVNDNMNNWAVSIEADMVEHMYGYNPHIAWIPERVWLSPGVYPDAGVIDWIGDNFQQHGINGVILDDWPHCNGSSSTKIHWMNNGSGVELRVIPINGNFVGAMHNDAGSAINIIQNTGQYDLVVYGTDWEFAAEVQQGDDPWMLDRYEDVINWCAQNYPAVNVWKLDDAINNSDFNGNGIEISNATYSILGGFDGYGGNNNSWYTAWAGTPSESDFHNPPWNYGYIWADAYNNLATAPNNQIAQLGWYTLMVNLYETGWHEGGVIAEWEKHHSTHIKNANVYAEASRWANGDYAQTTAAFFNDIDHDGGDELVMHNDKVFAVFEGIGGKINWMYYKDGLGNAYSVIGSDMAYWSETNGDYNESSNNHVAGLSDVSPNQQDAIYDIEILENVGDFVRVDLSQWGVKKTIELSTGNSWLDVKYDFFGSQGHIKSGWSPDLLDLIWSGKSHLQRVFGDWASYAGYRNSSSGATAAFVLGSGGGQFQSEFEGTLVKGDEIYGFNRFNFKLFAGYTSDPYFGSKVLELDDLAETVVDEMGPQILNAHIISPNHILVYIDENLIPEAAENIENYLLESEIGTENIISAELQWERRILLTTSESIEETELTLTINNISDFNGNNLEWNQIDVVTLEVVPHLVGTLNNWEPDNHDYDFIFNEHGFWELELELNPGNYQYKILESDQWDGNDWPSNNQSFELEEIQTINFVINPGFYIGTGSGDEFVLHQNPIVTGNFMDEVQGDNWNIEDLTGEMVDSDRNGVYEWEIQVPSGNWEYKVVLNENWEQDTHGNGVNFSFYSNGSDLSLFTYDVSNNSTSHELIEFTDCEPDGDVNFDGLINVVDVVSIVNFILGIQEFTEIQQCSSDRNMDGLINVADIVLTVNEILE